MRIEELTAIGFECTGRLGCCDVHCFGPSPDHDAPTLAIDGGNDPLWTHRIGERLSEYQVRLAVAEQRRADDDGQCSIVEHFSRAFDRTNATADTRGEPRRDLSHQRIVGAAAHRRVEINQLDLWESREACHPAVEVVALER